MDFMNRNQQSNSGGRPSTVFSAGAPSEPEQSTAPVEHRQKEEKSSRRGGMPMPNSSWFRWGGSAAVVIVALLIGAALALLVTYRPATEGDLVDTDKIQAVFLTNDQVYFCKITAINKKYVVLTNIYYLQTSGSTTDKNKTANNNSNISLVKLGCELHKPQDRMVIQQDQVSFWENLQSDGQVAKAVKSYQETNPNGQTCDTTSTNTNPVQGSTSTGATANPTTTKPTSTTPSTTTDTNKPN
jgi:hypothetical protein